MYNKLVANKNYKSKNLDGTYMYFKVRHISKGYVYIYVYKDNDTSTKLRSDYGYTINKSSGCMCDYRITELTKSELLALVL